jgi:hypothetical protein
MRISDPAESIEFGCFSKNVCSTSVIGNRGHAITQVVRHQEFMADNVAFLAGFSPNICFPLPVIIGLIN